MRRLLLVLALAAVITATARRSRRPDSRLAQPSEVESPDVGPVLPISVLRPTPWQRSWPRRGGRERPPDGDAHAAVLIRARSEPAGRPPAIAPERRPPNEHRR